MDLDSEKSSPCARKSSTSPPSLSSSDLKESSGAPTKSTLIPSLQAIANEATAAFQGINQVRQTHRLDHMGESSQGLDHHSNVVWKHALEHAPRMEEHYDEISKQADTLSQQVNDAHLRLQNTEKQKRAREHMERTKVKESHDKFKAIVDKIREFLTGEPAAVIDLQTSGFDFGAASRNALESSERALEEMTSNNKDLIKIKVENEEEIQVLNLLLQALTQDLAEKYTNPLSQESTTEILAKQASHRIQTLSALEKAKIRFQGIFDRRDPQISEYRDHVMAQIVNLEKLIHSLKSSNEQLQPQLGLEQVQGSPDTTSLEHRCPEPEDLAESSDTDAKTSQSKLEELTRDLSSLQSRYNDLKSENDRLQDEVRKHVQQLKDKEADWTYKSRSMQDVIDHLKSGYNSAQRLLRASKFLITLQRRVIRKKKTNLSQESEDLAQSQSQHRIPAQSQEDVESLREICNQPTAEQNVGRAAHEESVP